MERMDRTGKKTGEVEMGPETINGVYIQVKLRATGYGEAGMGLWCVRTPGEGQV